MIRSATSSALNYGEAQNAESKRDFIHTTSIVLKELRETHINLQILYKTSLYSNEEEIKVLLKRTMNCWPFLLLQLLLQKEICRKRIRMVNRDWRRRRR
jgi:four helix bundle protein